MTPDSFQYLLHDLFEKNTFWELETERATAQQTEAGAWQVTLDVRARKVVVDEAGVATEVPMDDWLEVGVLDEGEPSRQKFRIRSGKQTITEIPGTSYFSSADSFAMIRGGHIDLSILGAMEVSEEGDLANWMIPGKMVKGMGGAMDLVAGVKRVVVVMEHTNKAGESKILKKCSLPLTGKAVVDLVITDLCVFEVDRGKRMRLVELAPSVTLDEVKTKTEANFEVSESLKEMALA